MGDVLEADSASFTATVSNLDSARAARPGAYSLSVLRDGQPLLTVPLPATGDTATLEFPSLGHARYGLGVFRPLVGGASIEAYSTPIWLEPDPGDPPPPIPDCSAKLTGTAGPDVFAGTPESDAFDALRGRDRVRGQGGNDCLDGGGGADRVKGGAGVDVLRGRKGRDRLSAVDGEADRVGCGGGHSDRARVDAVDVVHGCERVRTTGA